MNSTRKYLLVIAGLFGALGLSAQSPSPVTRLIVRGDDMGFTQSANEATLLAITKGIQTTVEIMPNTPWFAQAVTMLKAHPKVDVGIHLTLTSEWEQLKWRPLTQAPSLVDENGYFYPFIWPNKDYPNQHLQDKPWKLDEIKKEFTAQIEAVRKHLPWASHLSAHMGCTGMHEDIKQLALRLAKKYGLEVSLDQVVPVTYRGSKKTSQEKTRSFMAMLQTLEPGKTYLFVDHPAFDTPEMKAIRHIGYENVAEDRQGVADTWMHPDVIRLINEAGIRLISYRDLKTR